MNELNTLEPGWYIVKKWNESLLTVPLSKKMVFALMPNWLKISLVVGGIIISGIILRKLLE